MRLVKEYLELFDIFGYDLTFRHKNFIKFTTYYGGLITIFCTGFLIYAFLNLSKDCLKKINPIVRETNYYDDYSIVYADKFFFAFYFTDSLFTYMPNPEKYLIFHGVVTNYTNESETTIIPFIKCDIEKHFNRTEISIGSINDKISNFDKTYCLDLDQGFNLINSGTEIPRLSLSLYVIECKNTTIDSVDCIIIFVIKFCLFFPRKKNTHFINNIFNILTFYNL